MNIGSRVRVISIYGSEGIRLDSTGTIIVRNGLGYWGVKWDDPVKDLCSHEAEGHNCGVPDLCPEGYGWNVAERCLEEIVRDLGDWYQKDQEGDEPCELATE